MEKPEILKRENTFFVVNQQDLEVLGKWIGMEVLAGQPKPTKPPDEERPITQEEAIKFLGKSRQTLASWRKKGVIKSYRLGGRIYYKPAELVAALRT